VHEKEFTENLDRRPNDTAWKTVWILFSACRRNTCSRRAAEW